MMHGKTKNALLNLSFPTDLISKIEQNNDTLASLRECNRENLLQRYNENEVDIISEKIKREPIQDVVIDSLFVKANGACSLCATGDSSLPFQIHHIEEYSRTQNNSEENLLLVCPTCHSSIHKKKTTYEEQKSKKRIWESIVALAKEYELKGIIFPYGAFDAIDYSAAINFNEIFNLGRMSPATCGVLFGENRINDARKKIEDNNYLIISGASGSGKTSYALSIGFSFSKCGFHAYTYIQSIDSDNRKALQEIAKFASTSVRNCILIIDDANQKFNMKDVREISSYSNDKVKIIICFTSEKGDKLSSIEITDKSTIRLTWSSIKNEVVSTLLKNEDKIIEVLRTQRKDDNHFHVGYGPFGTPVEEIINRYSSDSETVWQFMFLISAGWRMVDQSLQQLIESDRADLYILSIAIKQIAEFESSSSVQDVQSHLNRTLSILDDDEFIRSQIETLAGAVVVKSKGRYRTIHRDWARAYISASMKSNLSRPLSEKLINESLSINQDNIRRILILWSWFKYDEVLQLTIRAWYSRLSESDWANLFQYACESSLNDAASLANNMHLLFPSPQWREQCARIFSHSESAISNLISTASDDDIILLRHLFMAINHASQPLASRLILAWETQTAAKIIENSVPKYPDSVSWLLSGIKEHSPDWIRELSSQINWPAIVSRVEIECNGNVDQVGAIVNIGRILNIPFMRSLVKQYVNIICKILATTSLEKIQIQIIQLKFIELIAFQDELQRICDAVQFESYAKSLSTAKPAHWGKILSIFSLLSYLPAFNPNRFFSNLEFDDLLSNIGRWHKFQPHEFRLLIYTLAYADNVTKESFAESLFPHVCECVTVSNSEKNDILRAYAKLSSTWCTHLCNALEIEHPVTNVEANESKLCELQAAIAIKDSEGTDYDITGL